MWKLVPDSSLQWNISDPYCNKFEVVSPILNATTNTASTSNDDCGGNGGLDDCKTIILYSIKEISSITLNASMAFHVHVNAGQFNLEKEIDTLMPPSRRANWNRYCQSNCDGIEQKYKYFSDGRKHKAIIDCRTTGIDELCNLINPIQDRYYGFNLQNLEKCYNNRGIKTTIEFQQHSLTCNYNKVDAWVRFCTRFVSNSTLYRPNCINNDDFNDPFELPSDTVIQNVELKQYYRQRKCDVSYDTNDNNNSYDDVYDEDLLQQKLAQDTVHPGHSPGHRHGQCCDNCAEGHGGCQQ